MFEQSGIQIIYSISKVPGNMQTKFLDKQATDLWGKFN